MIAVVCPSCAADLYASDESGLAPDTIEDLEMECSDCIAAWLARQGQAYLPMVWARRLEIAAASIVRDGFDPAAVLRRARLLASRDAPSNVDVRAGEWCLSVVHARLAPIATPIGAAEALLTFVLALPAATDDHMVNPPPGARVFVVGDWYVVVHVDVRGPDSFSLVIRHPPQSVSASGGPATRSR